ncbi:ribbon-helix-helix domain-containing protein [Microbispora sp. CA-135349]|uniref:ribbon-helix-helix domain-containing protein n=1 Tax=Microbispora sp. CA-135349 TaxID=3239953 RepID=UPI003D9263B0
MAVKISISIPEELHDEVKAWADQTGGTVSGFFADLAQQRLDADRRSRQRLRELIEKDRAADPKGYDAMRNSLRERMHAAQVAAAQKAAEFRSSGAA